MIMGGVIKQNSERIKRYRVFYALVTVGAFFLYVYQVFHPLQGHLEIVQLYAGFLFSSGLACFIISFEEKIPSVEIISFVGNLTLEIYLVQFMLVDAFKYFAFPLNILLCMITIVSKAYCVNFLSEKIKKGSPLFR